MSTATTYETHYSICLWHLKDQPHHPKICPLVDAIQAILTREQQNSPILQQALTHREITRLRHEGGGNDREIMTQISQVFIGTLGSSLKQEILKLSQKIALYSNPDNPKTALEQIIYLRKVSHAIANRVEEHGLDFSLYVSEKMQKGISVYEDFGPQVMDSIFMQCASEDGDFYISQTDTFLAAQSVMADTCNLQEISFKQMATPDALENTLREKGPLVVNGFFGEAFYKAKATHRFTIEDYHFYGWPKDAPFEENSSFLCSAIVVGSAIVHELDLVLWRQPNEPTLYVSRFSTFIEKLLCLLYETEQIESVEYPNEDIVPVAYSNFVPPTTFADWVTLQSIAP